MGKAKRFRRRVDADDAFQSILVAVRSILSWRDEFVLRKHKKRLLNSCLWQLTQCEFVGKYNLKWASAEAARVLSSGKNKGLQHEHVYPRKQMIERLLSAKPSEVAEILQQAEGCVVTKSEHERLADVDPALTGWDRYREAAIAVVDRETDAQRTSTSTGRRG